MPRTPAVGNPAWYKGAFLTGVAAITAGLTVSRTTCYAGCGGVHASIKDTTFTGTGDAVNPYFRVEATFDWGYSSDTRTVTDEFGRSIRLVDQQLGAEAFYIYPEGSEGTQTLTINLRVFNSLDGSFITASTSTNITVSALPTSMLRMYISTAGDDANDGNDPNGFALTAATLTNATKRLNQTGLFAGYNHTTTNNVDIGAAQHTEVASVLTGGLITHPGLNGGIRG